jgi:hypothetical protein
MNPREQIALQLGMLVMENLEMRAHIQGLQEQLQNVQQKLHDAKTDANDTPSGAPAPAA